ncbi:MAG: hypothetical protein V4537_16110 [Pseudomonadota bacterium]
MTDSPWLTELTAMAERQAHDDDPAEQMNLAAQELLASVPNDEIRSAYLATDAEPGNLIADALLAAIEVRNIDL